MATKSRRIRRGLVGLILGLAAFVALPGSAFASTVKLVSIDGMGTLMFEGDGIDGSVEPNDATIGRDAMDLFREFSIADTGATTLLAVPPCSNDPSAGPDPAKQATCPDPLAGVTEILFNGNDGIDKVAISAAVASTLNGGDGNDELTGGPASDTLDGGDGDDELNVRDGVTDEVTCGPGNDDVLADGPGTDTITPGCEIIDFPGAPGTPTITDSDPDSPANENDPEIKGNADAGTTVKLYTSTDCTGSPVATGSASTFNSPGLTVNVVNDTATNLRATATDIQSNVSGCSTPFTYVEDSTQPTITTVSPAENAVDVAAETNVEVTFAEPMKQPVTEGAFSLTPQGSTESIAGSFEAWQGNKLIFNPTANLDPGTDYTATVGTGAEDVAGNPLNAEKGWTFTTSGPDTTPPAPPTITTTEPVSPANDNNPKVRGTVDAGNPTQVKLYKNATCTAPADATGTVATFTGAGISVSVSDNSTTALSARTVDAAGNESTCSNSIDYVEDSILPQVTAVSPAEDATDVPVTTAVEVTFSEPMDQASAESAFSFTSEGGADVAGTATWNGAGDTMTFTPDAALDHSTTYTAAVGTGAQDFAGNALDAEKSWSFTTEVERPANDDFADPENLGSGSTASSAPGDTNFDATKEFDEPKHAGDPGGASVWYTWTAPSSGFFRVDTCDRDFDFAFDFDTLLAIYRGTEVSSLSRVTSNDQAWWAAGCEDSDQSMVRFAALDGTTYHIAVDGYSFGGALPDQGGVELHIEPTTPGPDNDTFGDAEDLGELSNASVTDVSNEGATREEGEPDHAGNWGGSSLWYEWKAPSAGEVTVDTCGSDVDTLLAIYTGEVVGSLNEVASNDNFFDDDNECGFGIQSRVTFTAQAGVTYRIAVDGWDGEQGSIGLNLVGPPPPVPETPVESGPAQEPSGPAQGTPVDGGGKKPPPVPVDNDPPQTVIVKALIGTVRGKGGKATVLFRFVSDEPKSTFECKLDGGPFEDCDSPERVRVKEGEHIFKVRATDAAGNTDRSPTTREFTVKGKRKKK